MKKLTLFVLCACMVVVSCGPSDTSKMYTINLPEALDNMGLVNISELAKSIRYIPLETKEESLIGEYPYISYDGKHIIVADRQTNIIRVFDNDGRFIRNINRIGRGPEEFSSTISNVSLVDGNIVVMTGREVVEYDISDHFVRRVAVPHVDGYGVMEPVIIGENCYAAALYDITSADKEYCAVMYDSLSNVNQLIAVPDNSGLQTSLSEGMGVGIMLARLFQNNERSLLFYPESKEILSISTFGAIDTAYVIEYGGCRIPDGNTYNASQNDRYISLLSLVESEDYLFMKMNTMATITTSGSRFMNFLYDKKTRKSAVLYDKAEDRRGFRDDIGNGPEFWPKSVYGKKVLLSDIEAFSLLEFAENHTLSKDFERVVATIDENSNPVVVIVELK